MPRRWCMLPFVLSHHQRSPRWREHSALRVDLFAEKLGFDHRVIAPQPGNLLCHELAVSRHLRRDHVRVNPKYAFHSVLPLRFQCRPHFPGQQRLARPGRSPKDPRRVRARRHWGDVLVEFGCQHVLRLVDFQQSRGRRADDVRFWPSGKKEDPRPVDPIDIALFFDPGVAGQHIPLQNPLQPPHGI